MTIQRKNIPKFAGNAIDRQINLASGRFNGYEVITFSGYKPDYDSADDPEMIWQGDAYPANLGGSKITAAPFTTLGTSSATGGTGTILKAVGVTTGSVEVVGYAYLAGDGSEATFNSAVDGTSGSEVATFDSLDAVTIYEGDSLSIDIQIQKHGGAIKYAEIKAGDYETYLGQYNVRAHEEFYLVGGIYSYDASGSKPAATDNVEIYLNLIESDGTVTRCGSVYIAEEAPFVHCDSPVIIKIPEKAILRVMCENSSADNIALRAQIFGYNIQKSLVGY